MVNDAKKKENDMNKRMDNFARNLNGNLRGRNNTLYSEERHIGNKEKLEDRAGLKMLMTVQVDYMSQENPFLLVAPQVRMVV